jgi:antitoxin (DNA-binding transcriptional repressor) of toxin-antitoxin stability system
MVAVRLNSFLRSIMKKANISKIRAEFSNYIRYVKQGEEVFILERDKVVAKIVGIDVELKSNITVIPARQNLEEFLLKADSRIFNESEDVLDLLISDREGRI